MKKKLIRIGFYKELKHGRSEGESLHAVLQPVASPDDAKLVLYLKAGKAMMVAPGPVKDILVANATIGTLEIRTDGTYAWPSDFPHYIEKHHARPPCRLRRARASPRVRDARVHRACTARAVTLRNP